MLLNIGPEERLEVAVTEDNIRVAIYTWGSEIPQAICYAESIEVRRVDHEIIDLRSRVTPVS